MSGTNDEELFLCCLLWARTGLAAEMTAYEDQVLAMIPEHSGAVVQRAIVDGPEDRPREVQILRFASQAALDGYLADPRRMALSAERDRVVARTDVLPTRLI
ncbi:hypothetical protein [Kribbella sp. NPDC049584]|uniref:hypothetical protein n=1 Tax=Kribbella sp. NPDC049584 TaxID=3154833 RepID=UPI0034340A82